MRFLYDRKPVSDTACLRSLSVDVILLPKYGNWSTNFRALPLKVDIAPPHLKQMNSVLSSLTKRLMLSDIYIYIYIYIHKRGRERERDFM